MEKICARCNNDEYELVVNEFICCNCLCIIANEYSKENEYMKKSLRYQLTDLQKEFKGLFDLIFKPLFDKIMKIEVNELCLNISIQLFLNLKYIVIILS